MLNFLINHQSVIFKHDKILLKIFFEIKYLGDHDKELQCLRIVFKICIHIQKVEDAYPLHGILHNPTTLDYYF